MQIAMVGSSYEVRVPDVRLANFGQAGACFASDSGKIEGYCFPVVLIAEPKTADLTAGIVKAGSPALSGEMVRRPVGRQISTAGRG